MCIAKQRKQFTDGHYKLFSIPLKPYIIVHPTDNGFKDKDMYVAARTKNCTLECITQEYKYKRK